MRTQRHRELGLHHLHLHRGLLDGRWCGGAGQLLGQLALALLRLRELALELLEFGLEAVFDGRWRRHLLLLDRSEQTGVLLLQLCDPAVGKSMSSTSPSVVTSGEIGKR